ncbi:MAG TPA: efflux RND transporter periplasmic adaptor subunit [Melioribacteraceae bacterium]|nr:efflux RND transporter periplasmic adaptor subunit [Melioribacteraceae bacterium]
MSNGKKNSKKKLIIFGGLGVLLLVIILLVAFSGNKEDIFQVQTELTQRKTITQVVSATGKINPVFLVKITAEATGEIVSLLVREGDRVSKGQLLLRIKPDIYEAQKTSAEARLAQTKANLSSTKALLDKVEADYKRVQGLFQKGLASDSELEAAKSSYLQTNANYESQKSSVAQSEASLKEAVENLNKTYVYAPMNGTVSVLDVELNERVIGSVFQGTALLTVADLSQMEATVDVDENDVILVSVGDTSKIRVDAFGDKEFKGIVTQIGNSAKTTGLGTQDQVVNFEVKIKLVDPGDQIRPGMSCDADIETETKVNVLAVPIQSVTARLSESEKAPVENTEEEGEAQPQKPKNGKENKPKEVVFVVNDGKAKMIEVKTGISDDTYIEVIEGLKGDEEVVTGPYRAISKDLENDSKVSVTSKRKDEKKP